MAAAAGDPERGAGGSIGFFGLFTLAFGTIIGVGWVTVLGQWLSGAGVAGAAAAFILGAIGVGVIALCYAEVAAALPEEGGELRYGERAFGPFAGAIAGWFLAFAFVTVSAFEAISVGWIVSALAPALQGPALYEMRDATVYGGELAVGLGFMVLIAGLNILGARSAAAFQNFLTSTLILIFAAFVIAAFAKADPANLEPLFPPSQERSAFWGFAALLATTPFWFAGFNVLPQGLAERSRRFPLRRLGVLMMGVVIAAGVFYVLMVVGAALVERRDVLLSADLPAAAAFSAAFGGETGARLALFGALLGLLTTWNAVVFAGAHVLHALAARGAVPGVFQGSGRGGAPVAAVLLVAGVSLAMIFLGRGAIGPIVNTVGIIFSAMYLLTCLALIALRVREPALDRPYRAPGGARLAALGALIAAALLAIGVYQPSVGASWAAPLEWILLAGWGVLGIALIRPRKAAAAADIKEEGAS